MRKILTDAAAIGKAPPPAHASKLYSQLVTPLLM
jgi:hypothetical protein